MKPLTKKNVLKRRQAIIDEGDADMTALNKRRADRIQRLTALRARCPHDWKYSPDPSGNNDSYYYCPVCGQQQRHI